MDIITLHYHIIVTVCHLLAMVPLSIDVRSKVMSDTVRNADQRMHRTAALHFVEYLETPPSTNGIHSLASLLQVQSSSNNSCICQRCSTWSLSLISIPRLHATSLGTRTGLFLFFPGQSTFRTGQGTRQRIPGLSWTLRDTWQLCGLDWSDFFAIACSAVV